MKRSGETEGKRARERERERERGQRVQRETEGKRARERAREREREANGSSRAMLPSKGPCPMTKTKAAAKEGGLRR